MRSKGSPRNPSFGFIVAQERKIDEKNLHGERGLSVSRMGRNPQRDKEPSPGEGVGVFLMIVKILHK
jgi:hypothetical protein